MKQLLVIALLLISCYANAQQEPQYTKFWNNYGSFNPAYSGLENDIEASLTYRSQWARYQGPRTWNFNSGYKLSNANSGVGLNFTNENIGVAFIRKINGNYNYQLDIGNDMNLSTGIGVGAQQFGIDFSSLITPYGTNPCDDPTINCGNESDFGININTGIAFSYKNFRSGLSLTQLTQQQIGFYQARRHLFFTSSYRLNANSFSFEPFLLYKSDYFFYTLDVGAKFYYNNSVWIGTSYRNGISLNFMGGVVISDLINIGYAYDYYTFPSGAQIFGSTHEFSVSFKLNNQSNSGNTN